MAGKNKYDLYKLDINYKSIYIYNKYLTQKQFVKMYKGVDSNFFILDSGFIHEKILNRITIGFLDISQPDNDSIGRQRLRAADCEYRVMASLKLKNLEDPYFSYIRDRYEMVLVDIQKVDYVVTLQTTTNTFSVHSLEDYYDLISSHSGMFGTPFHWTYASKQKGKSIQLKVPVV